MFAAAAAIDLEGILQSEKADAYASETVWYKIKNRGYTQDEGQWKLFQKRAD